MRDDFAWREKYSFAGYLESDIGNLLPTIVVWIRANLQPDDVYSEEELRRWAIDNGFEESVR